jgi:hypothetical protein
MEHLICFQKKPYGLDKYFSVIAYFIKKYKETMLGDQLKGSISKIRMINFGMGNVYTLISLQMQIIKKKCKMKSEA